MLEEKRKLSIYKSNFAERQNLEGLGQMSPCATARLIKNTSAVLMLQRLLATSFNQLARTAELAVCALCHSIDLVCRLLSLLATVARQLLLLHSGTINMLY